jgi:hypothetical protein
MWALGIPYIILACLGKKITLVLLAHSWFNCGLIMGIICQVQPLAQIRTWISRPASYNCSIRTPIRTFIFYLGKIRRKYFFESHKNGFFLIV